jgi:hypothetical protein
MRFIPPLVSSVYINIIILTATSLTFVFQNFLTFRSFMLNADGVVQPDHFYPPLIIDSTMPVQSSKQSVHIFTREFPLGITQCLSMRSLDMTGLLCIMKHLLMLPLTNYILL